MGIRSTRILIILFLGLSSIVIPHSALLAGSQNQTSIPSSIYNHNSAEAFLLNDLSIHYFEMGMFFGFVIILLVYALLIFLSVKQPLFLWFFIYTFAISILLLVSEDYFFNLNWVWLSYFKIANSLIVFLAFIRFFQWVLDTRNQDTSLHTWMNRGFVIGFALSMAQFLFPDLLILSIINRLVVIVVISMVIMGVFRDTELSPLQKQFLKLSLFSVVLSGLSMTFDNVKMEANSVFVLLGFGFMVIHIFSYSIAVLFRIKKLTDKNESLWQEIRLEKDVLLQSHLVGMEEEKDRIGKELQLLVIKEIEQLAERFTNKEDKVKRELSDLTADLKLVTSGLTIDKKAGCLGLIKNIQELVDLHNEPELNIVFKHFNYTKTLSNANENHLFRITQEAVQNIEKYAKAGNVEIQLYQNEKEFLLTIEDDGVGFDSRNNADGIGIRNMKNRVAEMGGSFNLASSAGNGVSILIALNSN